MKFGIKSYHWCGYPTFVLSKSCTSLAAAQTSETRVTSTSFKQDSEILCDTVFPHIIYIIFCLKFTMACYEEHTATTLSYHEITDVCKNLVAYIRADSCYSGIPL